jgi:hypothetical protein
MGLRKSLIEIRSTHERGPKTDYRKQTAAVWEVQSELRDHADVIDQRVLYHPRVLRNTEHSSEHEAVYPSVEPFW